MRAASGIDKDRSSCDRHELFSLSSLSSLSSLTLAFANRLARGGPANRGAPAKLSRRKVKVERR